MSTPFDPNERPDELGRFDELDAPDQWDDIVARSEHMSVGHTRREPTRRRRNAWMLVAAAVAFALVGGLVLLQGDRGDNAVTTDTIDDPVSTTSPDTLPGIPPPTSLVTVPPSTTPTSVPASGSAWSPDCAVQAGSAEAPAPDDVLLDELGPLGAEPALELDVPTLTRVAGEESYDPFTRVNRVPGGLVVSLASQPTEPGAWILTAIDVDGSLRWRRCSSAVSSTLGTLMAPSELGPDRILVNEVRATDSSSFGQWRTIDLETGEDRPAPDGIQGTAVVGPPIPGSHHVLLAEPLGEQLIDTSTDQMVLVDLLAFETTDIPYPPDTDGQPASNFGYSVVDEGRPVILQLDFTDQGEVLGRYEGLEWRDPEPLVVGLVERVDFAGDAGQLQLEGLDGAGDPVWSRGDLTDPGGGHRLDPVDGLPGVTVVRACVKRGNAGCTDQALVGIDNETGETAWTQQPADVVTTGRAVSIVAANDEYRMIDNATGELVDESQQWSTVEFLGTDEDATSSDPQIWALGGLVVVTTGEGILDSGDTVRVFYPEAMSDGTVRVGLADGG